MYTLYNKISLIDLADMDESEGLTFFDNFYEDENNQIYYGGNRKDEFLNSLKHITRGITKDGDYILILGLIIILAAIATLLVNPVIVKNK